MANMLLTKIATLAAAAAAAAVSKTTIIMETKLTQKYKGLEGFAVVKTHKRTNLHLYL